MDPYTRELSPLYSPLTPWPWTVCFTQSPGETHTRADTKIKMTFNQFTYFFGKNVYFSQSTHPPQECVLFTKCIIHAVFQCSLFTHLFPRCHQYGKTYKDYTNFCDSSTVCFHQNSAFLFELASRDIRPSVQVLLSSQMHNSTDSNSCLKLSLAGSLILRTPSNITVTHPAWESVCARVCLPCYAWIGVCIGLFQVI